MLVIRSQESLQTRIGELQIVQVRCAHKLLGCTPHCQLLAVDKVGVTREDCIQLTAELLGDQPVEGSLFKFPCREQRAEIDCSVWSKGFIDLTVHMNCEARDGQEVLIKGDGLLLKSLWGYACTPCLPGSRNCLPADRLPRRPQAACGCRYREEGTRGTSSINVYNPCEAVR